MDPRQNPLIIFVKLAILLSCFRPSNCSCSDGKGERSGGGFKGMFVFGSSVVDNGNNNHLLHPSGSANHKPYGIDFQSGPTGRFTNGKTIADFVGEHLGLPLIPAFWEEGHSVVHGVNFGSSGSGILDSTGSMGGATSMIMQINEFVNGTVPDLEAALRSSSQEILPKYLFMVAAGNNDYVFNYSKWHSPDVTPEAFTQSLITIYSVELMRLYSVGARNFLLVTVYPQGCNPWIKEYTNTTSGCNQRLNLITRLFYTQLLSLVNRLNLDLPGSHFLILDAHSIMTNIIHNPLPQGFDNVSDSCCERDTTLENIKVVCKENGRVCANRRGYVFFDGQHYTEAVNAILAAKAFHSSNQSEIYPFNLCHLAHRI